MSTAAPEARSAGQTDNGGPGSPSELPSAVADAVVSALRKEGPSADPKVTAALGLGWYLAALAHPGRITLTAAAVRGASTGLGPLDDDRMLKFCGSHVAVAFAKLRNVVDKASPLPDEDLKELQACIDSAEEGARESGRRESAREVDAKVLSALSAVDFRLGKAYGVGAALMNLSTPPPAEERNLKSHLDGARIAPVIAAIDDLSTALPEHAGHGVRESLREWQKSVEGDSPVVETDEVWHLLARQGDLWRAVLAGEKAGTDMLEIEDYVDAADRLSKRMRSVAGRLVRRFPVVCAAILALFAAGVVLVAVFPDSAAAIVAGGGTILASLGLTWRGVGRSLGGLAAKLEQPLWGAELDVAVTQAITLLGREDDGDRDVTEARRKTASELDYAFGGSERA
jgi:hypothetical protein